MTDAPHRDNKQLNTLACARPCAAVWILMRNIATKESDRALRLSPTVSGLATATLHDPDASSHRSDQGHCATDVCPGALFQAWVLLAHTPKTGRGTGVSTEEKLDGTKKERGEEKRRKPEGGGSLSSENRTSRGALCGMRSTPWCFCQTATSLVRKWHYKLRRTSNCDSHPVWPRGGTGDFTGTTSL